MEFARANRTKYRARRCRNRGILALLKNWHLDWKRRRANGKRFRKKYAMVNLLLKINDHCTLHCLSLTSHCTLHCLSLTSHRLFTSFFFDLRSKHCFSFTALQVLEWPVQEPASTRLQRDWNAPTQTQTKDPQSAMSHRGILCSHPVGHRLIAVFRVVSWV